MLVGKVATFFNLIERALPLLMKAFESIRQNISTPNEEVSIRDLYAGISSGNFSDQVVAVFPHDLAVVCCTGGTDLGEPGRVISALDRKGGRPAWATAWADKLNMSV